MKTSRVALASLLFTFCFFFEYIPPFRQVHLPYDLEGFHYPLADYAFQSLKRGHIPQWDPTIYAGMNFTGNIQAALFYPPAWVMYAAGLGSEHLSYQALQDLVFVHVWLAFLLCYCWLREKSLVPLACGLGAGVFAFSGYMCTQLQHFGLVAAYTWIPLALWGIDQANQRRSWKPLWKVAAASALSFLAGYPPTWIVFLVCVISYGLATAAFGEPASSDSTARSWDRRWRLLMGIAVALAASMSLAMVQVLPAWEVSRMVEPDARYGFGVELGYLTQSWLVPNLWDFSMKTPAETNPGKSYFYLGAPAVLGLLSLLWHRAANWTKIREVLPVLGLWLACLVIVTNPFELVWAVVQQSPLLANLVRDWYFIAGVMPGFAAFTAIGLHDFLRRDPAKEQQSSAVPMWLQPTALVLGLLWIGWGLMRWSKDALPAGSSSISDAVGAVIILALTLTCFRIISAQEQSRSRRSLSAVAAVLVLAVSGIDYKTFGTSKRFDASPGSGSHYSISIPEADLGREPYREMLAHPDSRVLLEEFSLFPTTLRSVGLTTPLGFDPLLTTQYRRVVEANEKFLTDRTFEIDLDNKAALHLFGVRYIVSRPGAPWAAKAEASPVFRRLPAAGARIGDAVFEYLDAKPVWNWESAGMDLSGKIAIASWSADERRFQISSLQGGRVTLAEQYDPGWLVEIRPAREDPRQPTVVAPERWNDAFQAVNVPPGNHLVTFRFQSRWLRIGSVISLVSLVGLLLWIRTDWKGKLRNIAA